MAVPTNLTEALALLTTSDTDRISKQDVRDVVTWLASALPNVVANVTLTTGDNDNVSVASDVTCIRIDTAVGGVLTGLDGGVEGRVVMINNIDTADSFTITHDDAGSDAENRFYLPSAGAKTMVIHDGAAFRYDGTSLRWRLV